MKIEFNAAKRTLQGTGASRRLRIAGKVPGILYGGEKSAETIELDHNEMFHRLKQEAFHASILSMKMDGAAQPVLLRAVQMHPFRPIVLHLDFQRVEAMHKIHVKVPLHFINADIAPGIKLGGGIVSHVLNELDVTCLPADLPEFIEVDLKDATIGHSIHLSDITMPKGVEPAGHRGENPVVATVTIPRGAIADEAAAAETAVAAAAVPTTKQSAAPATPAAPAKPEKKS